jgi:hypothetical protein
LLKLRIVTAAQPAVAGATVALTRRTVLRKAVLGAWDPRVGQGWKYSLGLAADKHDVALHHTMRVVSHHHTMATPNGKNIAEFTRAVHQPMSCFLNTLLQRRGYDALDQVFDHRPAHRMRLLDCEAMVQQTMYQQMQNVASGLVRRPEDMPGCGFDFDLWLPGRTLAVRRPDVYFDPRTQPDVVHLNFTPPPELLALFGGDYHRLVHAMKKQERETLAALHERRRMQARALGKRDRYRGADAVRIIHPFDEPRTKREARGVVIPSFRVGARGAEGRALRIRAAMEVRAFREQNRECSEAWRAGDRDVVFPYGTDLLERQYGAQVAETPPDNAIVTAPGLLPRDVDALHPPRKYTTLSKSAVQVLAASGAEDVLSEGCDASGHDAAVRDRCNEDEHDVEVQTLHGSRRTRSGTPPFRIVVLRSRYARAHKKHEGRASDPPCD